MPRQAASSLLIINLLLAALCAAQAPAGQMAVSITGRVITLDGRPADDAQVELRDLVTQAVLQTAYTNATGQFAIANVSPGRYLLVATFGLDQASESLAVSQAISELVLRLPRSFSNTSSGNGNSVSVRQMQIPNQARRAYERARQALAKQRVDDAWKELEKALAIDPGYAEALVLRGLLCLDRKEIPRAQADMEQAVRSDPGYAIGYIALATVYNAQSLFDDALRALDRGVTLAPTVWQGYFETGKADVGKGEFAAALQHFDKAQALLDAPYAPLHLMKAQAMIGLKLYDQAASELQAYLSADPNGQDAGRARGVLSKVQAFVAASAKSPPAK